MSEALQKMVAAMAAELKRQDDDWTQYLDDHPWMKEEPAPGSEGYNLVKVARAGLEASDIIDLVRRLAEHIDGVSGAADRPDSDSGELYREARAKIAELIS